MKKIDANGTSTAFAQMTYEEIQNLIDRSLSRLYAIESEGDRPEAMLAISDVIVGLEELKHRGRQLQLPL